ncbi:MAG: DUF5723 family protein [Bacteroidota bacterium]|nr:DUF5723 family protein [Bacteroidota bacterium]
MNLFKNISLPILLIISLISKAQNSDDVLYKYMDSTSAIFMNFNIESNSNAMTNELLNKYIDNYYISDIVKDNAKEKLSDINRLGIDIEASAIYYHRPEKWKQKEMGYYLGIKDRYQFDLKFTADLFKLFFYGNKQFENNNAKLSDSRLYYTRFQQFEFGIIKKIGNSVFNFGIGINKGQQNQTLNIERSNLFTSEGGEYINFDLKYKYRYTDSTRNSYGDINGIGAFTDLYFSHKFKNSVISISAKDIGFIVWSESSYHIENENQWHFDGINVNDIIHIADNSFNSLSKDSVRKNILGIPEKGNYITMLPATININYCYNFSGNKWSIETGLRQKFFIYYLPLIYLSPVYRLTNNFIIKGTVSYGGYGNLNAGIDLSKIFRNGFYLRAGSNYINGLILPGNNSGQGAYISIGKAF